MTLLHSYTLPQVERGVAHKGLEVEVLGLGDSYKTTLTGIGGFNILPLPEGVLNYSMDNSQKCSIRNLIG